MVEPAGFEPATSSMPSRRAPNCATAPRIAETSYNFYSTTRLAASYKPFPAYEKGSPLADNDERPKLAELGKQNDSATLESGGLPARGLVFAFEQIVH
jgi:hypothetical protein